LGFGFWVLGFGFRDLRIRVERIGFRIRGKSFGFRVQGLEFWIYGLWLSVFLFQCVDLGFQIPYH